MQIKILTPFNAYFSDTEPMRTLKAGDVVEAPDHLASVYISTGRASQQIAAEIFTEDVKPAEELEYKTTAVEPKRKGRPKGKK